MPSRRVLSSLCGPGLLLGLACAFAVPQPAAAQFRAYSYYGYGAYDGGPYGQGPYGDQDYYDGPYQHHHRYYSPEEADLGPDPYHEGSQSPVPRRPVSSKAVAPSKASAAKADSNKADANKSDAKKTEPLTRDVIEKKVTGAGYKLIATPRHNGEIYLAEVEDNKANRRRLVYDAFDGRLIENTVLGPAKQDKAAAGKAD